MVVAGGSIHERRLKLQSVGDRGSGGVQGKSLVIAETATRKTLRIRKHRLWVDADPAEKELEA